MSILEIMPDVWEVRSLSEASCFSVRDSFVVSEDSEFPADAVFSVELEAPEEVPSEIVWLLHPAARNVRTRVIVRKSWKTHPDQPK